MQKRRFEYQNRAENSHKFWEVETTGNDAVVRYGRIGAEGSTQVKMFRTENEANAYANKMINEKLGKGYREATVMTRSNADAAAVVRRTLPVPGAVPATPAVTTPVGARRRAIRLME